MTRGKSLGIAAIFLAALFSFLVMFLSFYPGIFSPDLYNQLAQATGKIPFNDWHPPLMALIWKLGIAVTGKTSSLFVLEISIFILGLLLISLSGFLTGRFNLFWSLVVVLLPLYAPILIQTGRQWKDQLLTFLLVAAVAMLWIAGKKRRHLGLVAVFVFLASAAMLLRANGVFAVIFLLPLAAWRVRQALFEAPNSSARIRSISVKKQKLLAIGCVMLSLLLVTGGFKTVVEKTTHPNPTHQLDQLLLDDIVNVASVEDINALEVSSEFKKYLKATITKCAHCQPRQNLLWFQCADATVMDNPLKNKCGHTSKIKLENGTRVFPGIAYFHDEFMTAWIQTVPKHLPNYAGYRFKMFAYFIFAAWNPRLKAISADFNPTFPGCYKVTAAYVNTMTKSLGRVLFCPAFYLLISIVTLVIARRNRERLPKEHFLFSFWLSFASIFWLLSQIPIVPVPDYRYAYFSIVFTMLGLLYLASGLRQGRFINEVNCAPERGKK